MGSLFGGPSSLGLKRRTLAGGAGRKDDAVYRPPRSHRRGILGDKPNYAGNRSVGGLRPANPALSLLNCDLTKPR
jgi:hypothetical protein